MVVTRNQNPNSLPLADVRQAPIHRKTFGYGSPERLFQLEPLLGHVVEQELHPHEEGPASRIRRVLRGFEDVRAAFVEERRDGSNDSWTIGTRNEQPRSAQ